MPHARSDCCCLTCLAPQVERSDCAEFGGDAAVRRTRGALRAGFLRAIPSARGTLCEPHGLVRRNRRRGFTKAARQGAAWTVRTAQLLDRKSFTEDVVFSLFRPDCAASVAANLFEAVAGRVREGGRSTCCSDR